MTPRTRTKRPVLFIGYGEDGRAWLDLLAALCGQQPLLRPLMERRIVQFWAVDPPEGGRESDRLTKVSGAMAPEVLRELLDRGRSADNQAAVDGLWVRSVLVVERWSLFDEASLGRPLLRQRLATACRVGADPAHTNEEFQYEWIALADAVRSATPVSVVEARRVTEAVADVVIPPHTLLIDRVSASGAVVDRALAGHCFQQIALGWVSGDLAFPDPVSGPEHRSNTLAQPATAGAIRPVSVLTLQHRNAEIRTARARQMRLRLAQGLSLQDTNVAAQPRTPDLAELAEQDAAQLLSGGFEPHRSRVARDAAAEEFLRLLFLRRDIRGARQTITRARNSARRMTATPAPAAAGASALLPLAAIDGDAMTWLIPAAAVAVLGTAGWLVRRRSIKPSVPAPDGPRPASAEQRAATAAEWESLCDDLDPIVSDWQSAVEEAQPSTADQGDAPVWVQEDTPYDWRLVRSPKHGAPVPRIDADSYAELADACRRLLQLGKSADAVFDSAIERIVDAELRQNPKLAGSFIRGALNGGDAARIRRVIDTTPLLVNTGRVTGPEEVLWLADPDLGIEEALVALESANVRPLVRVLTHEDPARTLRLAIGESMPWHDVLSLKFLGDQ